MVSLVPSNLLTTQLSILCTLLLGWEHCRDLCWFLSLPGQGRRACEFKPLQQKKGSAESTGVCINRRKPVTKSGAHHLKFCSPVKFLGMV